MAAIYSDILITKNIQRYKVLTTILERNSNYQSILWELMFTKNFLII